MRQRSSGIHTASSSPRHDKLANRQLGHSAAMTLAVYGHVIDELAEAPRQDAEAAILAAREGWAARQLPIARQ